MKKLMFSALACIAFAFSGFASNEVVNETSDAKISENIAIEKDSVIDNNSEASTGDCNVRIVATDAYGRRFDKVFNYGNIPSDCCDSSKKDKVNELKNLGATIAKIETTWG